MPTQLLIAYVQRHTISVLWYKNGANAEKIFGGASFTRRNGVLTEDRVWELITQACKEEQVTLPHTARSDFKVEIGETVNVKNGRI